MLCLIDLCDNKFRMFDLSGKSIMVRTNVKNINVSDLKPGMYIMEISDTFSGDKHFERIIIH